MKSISSLVLGVTTAFSVVSADQKSPALTDKAHPSISAQVRLSSWWIARHAKNIAAVEAANDPKKDQKIELLMVGDSITNNFDKGGPGEGVWKKHFAPLNALNLGFGGDRTNHVLWRLDHLPKLKAAPKAASLMIGTNNICWGSDQPKQAADGVQAIAKKLNEMYPEMEILVLGVFRGAGLSITRTGRKSPSLTRISPNCSRTSQTPPTWTSDQSFSTTRVSYPKK